MKTLVILILLLARVCFGACNSAATMGWTPLSCAKTIRWWDPGINMPMGGTNIIAGIVDICKTGDNIGVQLNQVAPIGGAGRDNGWMVAVYTNNARTVTQSDAWTTSFHFFWEGKMYATGNQGYMGAATGHQFSYSSSMATCYNGTTTISSGVWTPTASYWLLEASSSSGTVSFFTNGVSLGGGVGVLLAGITTTSVGNINGGQFLNGDLSAFVVCNGPVSGTDLSMMRYYFGKRRFNHL